MNFQTHNKLISAMNWSIIPFFASILFYDRLNPDIMALNHVSVFTATLSTVIVWTVLLIVLKYIFNYSFNDFQFKIIFYVSVILTLTTFVFQLPLSELLEGKSIVLALYISISQLILTLAYIQKIFLLTQPISEQIRSIESKIKKREYIFDMDDIHKRDKLFYPFINSIETITDVTTTLIESTRVATQITFESTENIATATEEVNSSAEEVASTSQAMSEGATSQTELIFEVNNEISQLDRLINDIVGKIQLNTQEVAQIALQTNILALNAGIEASRAGDYGRGFAVVAENVRKLSDQSKLASERIEAVADEIRDTLQTSFVRISNSMLNVVSVSEETAASAEEVAAAAEEMTASMEEISSATTELNSHSEEMREFISTYKTK